MSKLTIFFLLIVLALVLSACTDPIVSRPGWRSTLSPELYDFGDAPDPDYPSLLTSDGARTHDPYQFWLGPLDSQTTIEPEAKVTDLDEADDGLVEWSVTNGKILLTIRLSRDTDSPAGNVYLNGLIDADGNGVWDSSAVKEWFIVNQVIRLEPGQEVTINAEATGNPETWIRLMVSDLPVKSDNWNGTGLWKVGEVEDYLLRSSGYETPTPFKTPTPTRYIVTTPGGNHDTATPTATRKWIETKKGGPTDTPTPTPPPPPAEKPVWSGNVCGGIDVYDQPDGQIIGRLGQSTHVYMLENPRSDGWVRIRAGKDTGWIKPNWNDPYQFGYDNHPCQ